MKGGGDERKPLNLFLSKDPKDYKFQAPTALKNLALLQAASGGKFSHLYKGAAVAVDIRSIQSPATIADSFGGPTASSTTPASIKRDGSAKSDKTVKQLLGEMYADKLYLEQLLNDRGKSSKNYE